MKLELAPISALGQCGNYNASDGHTKTHMHIHTQNLFLCPIVNLHFHHLKKACTKNGAYPPNPNHKEGGGGQHPGHGGQM